MCLFPTFVNPDSKAYNKGLRSFDCGCCPECLSKRARLWALRCSMQAKKSKKACMVTLTYDNYIYNDRGEICGETVADRCVDKKDCQKFIKRLRYYFPDVDIKYLLTAEYGKTTHRPHYHAILFGVDFSNDRVFYKKSKRGNVIFHSDLLSKIWNNGICTVDCVNINSKVARYCTKYCAKDGRTDDTFMLFSHGIGEDFLMRDFNGLSYFVDGVEYPIPKKIWFNKIIEKYKNSYDITDKYVGYNSAMCEKYGFGIALKRADRNRNRRQLLNSVRDNDFYYKRYLNYWRKKSMSYEIIRGSRFQRLLSLPNDKYYAYKQKALNVYSNWNNLVTPLAPRTSSKVRFYREIFKNYRISILEDNSLYVHKHKKKFALTPSCHIRANDRKKDKIKQKYYFVLPNGEKKVVFCAPILNVQSPF